MTFTICIINNTGADVTIQEVVDNFPDQWTYTNCGASDPGVGCDTPFSNGQFVRWFSNFTIPNTQQVKLTVTGHYTAQPPPPVCNRASNYTIVDSTGQPIGGGNDACVTVNP